MIRLQQAPLCLPVLCTQAMAVWPCCTALLQLVIAINNVSQQQVQRQVHAYILLRSASDLLLLVAPWPFLVGQGQ